MTLSIFISLSDMCASSLEKLQVKSFAQSNIGPFAFIFELDFIVISQKLVPYQIHNLQTLSPILGYLFTLLLVFFEVHKLLYFMKSKLPNFLSLLIFLVAYLRNHYMVHSHKYLYLIFLF